MRLWLAITGILLFAAGAAVGVVASGRIFSRPDADVALAYAHVDAPAYLVTGEEIYRELELSEPQRARLDDLLSAHWKRVSALRASLMDLAGELRRGIDDVLAKEQRRRFDEIQQRYIDKGIQGRVSRELMSFRAELGLLPEVEARLYPVLFDAEREQRETWKACGGPLADRDTLREKIRKIRDVREERIEAVLPAEKLDAYREMRERHRRRWDEKKKGPPPPQPGGPGPEPPPPGPGPEPGPASGPTPKQA